MQIKRDFLNDVRGSADEQKALAAAIYWKHLLVNSRMPKFAITKMEKVAGMNYRTIKKYLPLMQEREYVHFEGNGCKKTLVVNRLSSHRKKWNVDISEFDFSSFATVLLCLRGFMLMRVQASKDYMKWVMQRFHNPTCTEELKKMRQKVMSYVRSGSVNNPYADYKEYGISLKRMARELGCSVTQAMEVIDYTVSRSWMVKEHNFLQYFLPHVNYYELEDFTFTTANNAYKVGANTYTLSPTITTAFFHTATL